MPDEKPAPPLRVLLIDDDEDEFIITRALLNDIPHTTYELAWANSFKEGLDAIKHNRFDVYLIDYRLGKHDGLELVRAAHTMDIDAPCVLLTGQGDDATDAAAMEAGAMDYLAKAELNAPLLDRTIRYSLAQKRVEANLRASEERYRRFFEDDLTGDFIAMPDGRITACNPAFLKIFNFQSLEKAYDFSIERLFPTGETSWQALVDKVRHEKKVSYMETELRRLDGRTVYVIQNLIGEFDGAGELVSVKGYMFDNTERKLLEQELLQSQKMEAIGRLAGGVAHDFNNHLTAIMSYAGLAGQALPPDSPAQNDLKGIQQAAQSSAALTRQLLAFARKQIIKPQFLNLADAVMKLEKMLRRLIGENIELITLRDADVGLVKLDPGQVEQILMNMVLNARDAMPNGGKIIIETRRVTLGENFCQYHRDMTPGEYVQLVVNDTGMGMDAQTQKNIFEPFFTTKEFGRGTGLGLSTVFGIVKQNRGHILVYSEIGQGTTFKLYFPNQFPANTTPRHPPAMEEFPAGSEVILLVEDSEPVRELISRILADSGYTLLTAENGQHAIEVMRQPTTPHIDLVISDVVMPIENGEELLQHLQKIDPHLPVLFMSGYSDDLDVINRIRRTNMPFIEKPFSPMTLAKKVRAVLDNRQTPA